MSTPTAMVDTPKVPQGYRTPPFGSGIREYCERVHGQKIDINSPAAWNSDAKAEAWGRIIAAFYREFRTKSKLNVLEAPTFRATNQRLVGCKDTDLFGSEEIEPLDDASIRRNTVAIAEANKAAAAMNSEDGRNAVVVATVAPILDSSGGDDDFIKGSSLEKQKEFFKRRQRPQLECLRKLGVRIIWAEAIRYRAEALALAELAEELGFEGVVVSFEINENGFPDPEHQECTLSSIQTELQAKLYKGKFARVAANCSGISTMKRLEAKEGGLPFAVIPNKLDFGRGDLRLLNEIRAIILQSSEQCIVAKQILGIIDGVRDQIDNLVGEFLRENPDQDVPRELIVDGVSPSVFSTIRSMVAEAERPSDTLHEIQLALEERLTTPTDEMAEFAAYCQARGVDVVGVCCGGTLADVWAMIEACETAKREEEQLGDGAEEDAEHSGVFSASMEALRAVLGEQGIRQGRRAQPLLYEIYHGLPSNASEVQVREALIEALDLRTQYAEAARTLRIYHFLDFDGRSHPGDVPFPSFEEIMQSFDIRELAAAATLRCTSRLLIMPEVSLQEKIRRLDEHQEWCGRDPTFDARSGIPSKTSEKIGGWRAVIMEAGYSDAEQSPHPFPSFPPEQTTLGEDMAEIRDRRVPEVRGNDVHKSMALAMHMVLHQGGFDHVPNLLDEEPADGAQEDHVPYMFWEGNHLLIMRGPTHGAWLHTEPQRRSRTYRLRASVGGTRIIVPERKEAQEEAA